MPEETIPTTNETPRPAPAAGGPVNMKIRRIPPDQIVVNDEINSRRHDADTITEMAAQLADTGRQLQPVGVCANEKGAEKPYTLLYGFRRTKAIAQLLAEGRVTSDDPLGMVECVVLPRMSEAEAFAINTRENCNRRDLSQIEVAESLDRMINFHNLPVKEAASTAGLSVSRVSQQLRLITLPPHVKLAIHKGHMSAYRGYEIAKLPKPQMEAVIARLGDLTSRVNGREIQATIRAVVEADEEARTAAAPVDALVESDDGTEVPESDAPAWVSGKKGNAQPAPKPERAQAMTITKLHDILFDAQAAIEEDLDTVGYDYEDNGTQWSVLELFRRLVLNTVGERKFIKDMETLVPRSKGVKRTKKAKAADEPAG